MTPTEIRARRPRRTRGLSMTALQEEVQGDACAQQVYTGNRPGESQARPTLLSSSRRFTKHHEAKQCNANANQQESATGAQRSVGHHKAASFVPGSGAAAS